MDITEKQIIQRILKEHGINECSCKYYSYNVNFFNNYFSWSCTKQGYEYFHRLQLMLCYIMARLYPKNNKIKSSFNTYLDYSKGRYENRNTFVDEYRKLFSKIYKTV